MNYYDLSKFETISVNELLESFLGNKTIRSGCIGVFDDTIGRPGDVFYKLLSIVEEGDTLIFNFETSTLTITNPEGIVINEKVIGVTYCSKVSWTKSNVNRVYKIENGELITNVSNGEHFFNVDTEKEAFLFYSW